MIKLVSIEWVAQRAEQHELILVDARRPMKYLMGHLPGAINLPAYKFFGSDGALLAPELLADLIGNAGLGNTSAALIYDSPEGQNGAILAWILEYLGHSEICVLEAFFEAWNASGREILYKPISRPPATFTVRLNPAVRASLDELRNPRGIRFVDFRSREEYCGTKTMGEDQAGHIPGAVNFPWQDLGRPPGLMLKPAAELASIADSVGVNRGDQLVAYCRSGPRAALGYLALRLMGAEVRLFDGSFAQWSKAGLPAEK